MVCWVYMQGFLDKHFPTREVFAALAAFVLQVAPDTEQEIQAYKAKRFKLYTIGMQIRRRKCNGDRKDLHCEYRPSIESYCQVGIRHWPSPEQTICPVVYAGSRSFSCVVRELSTFLLVRQVAGVLVNSASSLACMPVHSGLYWEASICTGPQDFASAL